jgi:hypothetical protein
MPFPDRIIELRRVRASELLPHPRNWRRHPPRQREALRGILAEVGFADALLARELPDGRLQLIDGHLRAETAPDQLVPVLVLDVNEIESAKLLASLDPLAALAEADGAKLDALLEVFQTENAALAAMLDELAESAGAGTPGPSQREPEIPEVWQVVVACRSEDEQRELFDRLIEQGYDCRVLVM